MQVLASVSTFSKGSRLLFVNSGFRSCTCTCPRLIKIQFFSTYRSHAQQNKLIEPPIGEYTATSKHKPTVLLPTREQLLKHFINAAIPMVGFGFMDNLIMLQAGEMIDTSIGVTFGLSTLTAAAVGQIFSDMSGVCFGGIVQVVGTRFVPSAGLTSEQQRLGVVRAVATMARMIGVLIGCCIGMTSLLFMDLEESERLRRFRELQPILHSIVKHTKRSLGVRSCRIYLLGVDSSGNEVLFDIGDTDDQPVLERIRGFSNHFNHKEVHPVADTQKTPWWSPWTTPSSQPKVDAQVVNEEPPKASAKLITGNSCLHCVRLGPESESSSPSSDFYHSSTKDKNCEPIVKYVARTGQAVMCRRQKFESQDQGIFLIAGVKDNTRTQLSSGNIDKLILTSTLPISHSLLCYPVFDDIDRDRVIGVIELADKVAGSAGVGGFTRDDERLVRMLSEHLSLYLALGARYKHNCDAGTADSVESVEKIGWKLEPLKTSKFPCFTITPKIDKVGNNQKKMADEFNLDSVFDLFEVGKFI